MTAPDNPTVTVDVRVLSNLLCLILWANDRRREWRSWTTKAGWIFEVEVVMPAESKETIEKIANAEAEIVVA